MPASSVYRHTQCEPGLPGASVCFNQITIIKFAIRKLRGLPAGILFDGTDALVCISRVGIRVPPWVRYKDIKSTELLEDVE
eukprot:COSAG02_NODE_4585_length_5189_cov_9.203929_1_plen_81_part_00